MKSRKSRDDTVNAPDEAQTTAGPRWAPTQVVLAGIGALATCIDTAGEQFDRYVSRGEKIRQEVQERTEDARRQNWRAQDRARDYFRGAMDVVLDTFNVPSRTDVDTINVKLNILTRKLDDLQMQGSGTSGEKASTGTDAPPESGELTT
jgi:polyhydroxyalkanoate synthesis regulator phasin